MKIKIKVFEKTDGCFPQEFEIGEWYDLCTSKNVMLSGPTASTLRYSTKKNPVTDEKISRRRDVTFESMLIPLGVCIEIPKGFESIVIPRSSTFKKYGLVQTNSVGLIDNSYSSEKDEWKFPVIATRDVVIPKGTRICQFRIQLSQKATTVQKLKWLFSNSVELVKVDHLDNPPRGGFGKGTDTIDPNGHPAKKKEDYSEKDIK